MSEFVGTTLTELVSSPLYGASTEYKNQYIYSQRRLPAATQPTEVRHVVAFRWVNLTSDYDWYEGDATPAGYINKVHTPGLDLSELEDLIAALPPYGLILVADGADWLEAVALLTP